MSRLQENFGEVLLRSRKRKKMTRLQVCVRINSLSVNDEVICCEKTLQRMENGHSINATALTALEIVYQENLFDKWKEHIKNSRLAGRLE